jgi:hypothetical protein
MSTGLTNQRGIRPGFDAQPRKPEPSFLRSAWECSSCLSAARTETGRKATTHLAEQRRMTTRRETVVQTGNRLLRAESEDDCHAAVGGPGIRHFGWRRHPVRHLPGPPRGLDGSDRRPAHRIEAERHALGRREAGQVPYWQAGKVVVIKDLAQSFFERRPPKAALDEPSRDRSLVDQARAG